MNAICCPICSQPLSVSVAKGRKSGKPFIMLKCNQDGRHFRAFITDKAYVRRVLDGFDLNTDKTKGLNCREGSI
ncbi:MAG: hypothetical protein WC231_01365 [Dehalococcoidales bacterium]|jgi:hypothetical protein|nr:hypothetical protein [Dehalococcoidales bacterium]MDD5605144.1 hypothetical protein [Dehalococcoidales bacterium]MDX9986079.1 hypothetical protein [Dehalococcoidales bacterium]